jgi:hypothetical protein
MCWMILLMLGEAASKTHVFRCFHNHQATSMTKELNPFFLQLDVTHSADFHHSWNTTSFGPGAHPCNPTLDRILNQTSLAKTQPTRRCYAVSSCWSQRRQRSGWSSPLRASRSAVQHLLRVASHMKNLHLGGAQFFQMRLAGSKPTAPTKKRL